MLTSSLQMQRNLSKELCANYYYKYTLTKNKMIYYNMYVAIHYRIIVLEV